MKKEFKIVLILSILAMAILLFTSLAAILMDDSGNPYIFANLQDETVEIYGGHGLYQFDTTYKAVMFRAFDWVSLLLIVPLFAIGISLFRRGKLKGQLLLASLFTYLAYIYLIGVMGNIFNILFLPWTALFSLGLFGLFFTVKGMDLPAFPATLGARFPRKSVSIYVIALGLILLIQYLVQIIGAYTSGTPPAALDHYTTLELASLEIGIMVPLHILAGILLWQKKSWGYILATLLAFAAATVFVALNAALLMLSVWYGQGTLSDVFMPMLIMIVAGGFSIAIFAQSNDSSI